MDNYLKTRMAQKADTAENWAKVNDFRPLLGEIVVYLFEEENLIKIKVGDGKTLIQDLPFLKGEIDTTTTPDLTDIQQQIDSLMESKASKEEASSKSAGLMSSTDKIKLDGLKNYELPVAGKELGGVKTTSNVSDISNYSATPIVDGIPYFKETVIDSGLTEVGKAAEAKIVGDEIKGIKNDFSSLKEKIEIQQISTPNTNLNDYKTQGIYLFTSGVTPLNVPEGNVNGWLIVIARTTTGFVKQLWLRAGTINSSDQQIFVRTTLGGTWSDWTKLLNSKSIDSTLTKANFVPDAKATGDAINARVLKNNTGEAHIIVGTNNDTLYRFALTTASNLRVDSSTDGGATWGNKQYFAKADSSNTSTIALSNSGGTFGAPSVRYSAPGTTGSVAFSQAEALDGAGIWLYGNDHSNAGKFRLQVYDTVNKKYRQLDGCPDGTLTWDKNKVYTAADTIPLATAAEKLKTAHTMQVDLGSQSEATFDGTSNIRLGVTGILPPANGGTGNTAGIAPSAMKLATAQNIWVDLESILTTESFDGTKAVNLGVLGVLPIISGGTGARAAKGAAYNLFGDETNMSESTTDVKDDNLIVFRYTNPSSENGVFTYKKASTIWTWLQSKLSSSNLKVNTLTLGSTAGEAHITFSRDEMNYLVAPTNAKMAFAFGGAKADNTSIVINKQSIYPQGDYTSGTRDKPWSTVYANNFVGTTARHYAFRKTFYVDGSVTTSGNGEEKSPFKTIDEAFNMMNKGYPNLGVVIQTAGNYTFTQRSFVGMCLHISKKSGIGDVNLICTDDGLVAFYSSHINSDGINWYGQKASPTSTAEDCQPLYFEGCAVTIKDGTFGPRLQLFGGNLVATNIITPCVYLSYCFAKLDGLTVKPGLLNNASGKERTIRGDHITRLFFTYLTDIYCASSIKFDFSNNKLSKLEEVHHVDSGTFRIMNTFSGTVPSGLYSKFYRTTIYNPKNSANTTDHKTILSNNVTIAENAVTWVNEK